MVASDPHLSHGSPPTFYEGDVNGRRSERLTLYGVTFRACAGVVHGTNGHVSWGSTVNPTDVTDVYQEQLTIAGGVPVATTYKGNLEPTQIIPRRSGRTSPATARPTTSSSYPPPPESRPRRSSCRAGTTGR